MGKPSKMLVYMEELRQSIQDEHTEIQRRLDAVKVKSELLEQMVEFAKGEKDGVERKETRD